MSDKITVYGLVLSLVLTVVVHFKDGSTSVWEGDYGFKTIVPQREGLLAGAAVADTGYIEVCKGLYREQGNTCYVIDSYVVATIPMELIKYVEFKK